MVITNICNGYGQPEFFWRRYYIDKRFTCAKCGTEEVWTAAQQKWWYEVAFMECIYHRLRFVELVAISSLTVARKPVEYTRFMHC